MPNPQISSKVPFMPDDETHGGQNKRPKNQLVHPLIEIERNAKVEALHHEQQASLLERTTSLQIKSGGCRVDLKRAEKEIDGQERGREVLSEELRKAEVENGEKKVKLGGMIEALGKAGEIDRQKKKAQEAETRWSKAEQDFDDRMRSQYDIEMQLQDELVELRKKLRTA